MNEPRGASVGYVAAFLALIFWASQAVVAKGVDIDPLPLVLYRIWMAAIWTILFLYLRRGRLSVALLRICIWGGVAFGFDLIFFFTALKLTTVANATVISSLQPVLLIFLAPRLFGEKIRMPDVAFAGVAIIGVSLVVFGSSGLPEWSPRGDLWSVLTLFAWTGYFVSSKLARARLSAEEFTAGATLVAAIVVTPFALLSGQDFVAPTGGEWFWIAMMAIGPGWLGHYLMNWALAYIPIWLGGSVALAIPVVSAGLAAIFLDEPIGGLQLAGMGIAIGGLVAITYRSQQVAPVVEPAEDSETGVS